MSDTTDAAAHVTAALSIIDDIAEWHLGANVLLVTARRHILALDAARVAAEQRADAAECERNCLEQLVSHLRGIGRANASDTQAYWDSVDTAYKAVYGDLDAAPGDTEGEAQP